MGDVWFRKLGFARNPFSVKPAAFSYELFGPDITPVLESIEAGKAVFVQAPLGHGKTTLLKGIIQRFGGRRKVVYAHVLPDEKLDVKELLKRSSFFSFITGSLPEGMILVVDEAQNIVPESVSELFEFYKAGNLRAVVFFGAHYPQEALVGQLGEALNGNLITLSNPSREQAISLVRSRVGNLSLLPNEVILAAYEQAGGSPRRLLQTCEDLLRLVTGQGRVSVTMDDFYSLFPRSAKKRAAEARRPRKRKTMSKRGRPEKRKNSSLSSGGGNGATQRLSLTPELSVSSTAGSEGVLEALSPEVVKAESAEHSGRDRKRGSRRRAKKAAAKPARKKRSRRSQQKASHSVTVSRHSEPAESDYWGDFMGMQK